MHYKTRKKVASRLSIFATIGAVASFGFLAFVGIWNIFPILTLATVTFFLAGAIEGMVFWENIKNAMTALFSKQYLRRATIVREVEKVLAQDNVVLNSQNSPMLARWQWLKKEIESLEEKSYLSKAQRAELKKHRRARHEIEYLIAQHWWPFPETDSPLYQEFEAIEYNAGKSTSGLEEPSFATSDDPPESASSNNNANNKKPFAAFDFNKRLARELRRTKWKNRLANLIATSSAIAGAAVTAYATHQGLILLGLGLSTGALTGMLAPVAIFAGVAYFMLIKHTCNKLIKNESVGKYMKQCRDYFKDPNISTGKKALKGFGLTLLASVILAATVAMAGTWWHMGRLGIASLPYIYSFLGVLVPIMVVFAALGELTFNIANIGESFEEWRTGTKNALSESFKAFKNYFKNNPGLIAYNPFRWMAAPILYVFRALAFAGHLAATGVSTDDVGKIPPIYPALAGTLNDSMVEFHYVFSNDFFSAVAKTLLSPLLILQDLWDYAARRYTERESGMKTPFMRVLAGNNSPLFYLVGAFHYLKPRVKNLFLRKKNPNHDSWLDVLHRLASKNSPNAAGTGAMTLDGVSQPAETLEMTSNKDDDTPKPLRTDWLYIYRKAAAEQTRLKDAGLESHDKKVLAWKDLKEAVSRKIQQSESLPAGVLTISNENIETLSEHRNGFFRGGWGQTQSEQVLNRLFKECPEQLRRPASSGRI